MDIRALRGRSAWDLLEGRGVDAVAQARRPRSVVEDVAQVSAAAGAVHLGARHAQGAVALLAHRALGQGLGEAGPAGPGVELVVGGEEGLPAGRTDVGPGRVRVMVGAREGPLGALLAHHVEL